MQHNGILAISLEMVYIRKEGQVPDEDQKTLAVRNYPLSAVADNPGYCIE